MPIVKKFTIQIVKILTGPGASEIVKKFTISACENFNELVKLLTEFFNTLKRNALMS